MHNSHAVMLSPSLAQGSWNFDQVDAVTLARRDGRRLHIAHVNALVDYCTSLMRSDNEHDDHDEMMAAVRDNLVFSQVKLERLLQSATKHGFAAYWQTWKMTEAAGKYSNVEGPYFP
jgi:hypothetical protein